ncbi:hypothetical protein L195_g025958 [Trifolium pratense]|uniref:Uncharacterized protein n=1 Tax=Trifolium pratense TaxID=57577 RepID=A0A2K3NHY7_TRIPR|nr:hypothetical protein L195_g025958 [Trifolium pratense]
MHLCCQCQISLNPFIIECGASGRIVGSVLSQGRHPTAHFSKILSKRGMENLGIQAVSKPLWLDFVEISQYYGDYEGSDTRFER